MNILILMAGSEKDFTEKGYPKYKGQSSFWKLSGIILPA